MNHYPHQDEILKRDIFKRMVKYMWANMVESAKLSYWLLTWQEEKIVRHVSCKAYVCENGVRRPMTEEELKKFRTEADAMLKEAHDHLKQMSEQLKH